MRGSAFTPKRSHRQSSEMDPVPGGLGSSTLVGGYQTLYRRVSLLSGGDRTLRDYRSAAGADPVGRDDASQCVSSQCA
jgi:hypothetical protein